MSWAFLMGLNIPQRPRAKFQRSWLASDDAEKSIVQTPPNETFIFPHAPW